jgi:hypothetical protein
MLVEAHQHVASKVAAGLSHLPDTKTAFAATQAAWRFFNNDRLTLSDLAQPLHDAARQALADCESPCALLIHDWSKIDYAGHTAKADLAQLTHENDIGYELATALLVSASDGSPLAPMELELTTADAVHSTRTKASRRRTDHLDQILPRMQESLRWNLGKPLVHIIDREADSVGHYRQWDKAAFHFLVRGDDRLVQWRGNECRLSAVAESLQASGSFGGSREVLYHGRRVRQEVAETLVTLHRPAKRWGPDGKQHEVRGRPLALRLVVVRLWDDREQRLAEWLLLANVPAEWADAASLALWYYWRWRIESYHKLLKSHGQQMEHWQQETGLAIARRLLVAAMACVVVWALERAETAKAVELREVLTRLSGRQMKTGRATTTPALLAGLHVLLSMLELLNHYDLDQLRQLVRDVLPTRSG